MNIQCRKEAEEALRKSATNIPPDVIERLSTADKLSDEDRKTMTDVARQALSAFHSKPKVADEKKP